MDEQIIKELEQDDSSYERLYKHIDERRQSCIATPNNKPPVSDTRKSEPDNIKVDKTELDFANTNAAAPGDNSWKFKYHDKSYKARLTNELDEETKKLIGELNQERAASAMDDDRKQYATDKDRKQYATDKDCKQYATGENHPNNDKLPNSDNCVPDLIEGEMPHGNTFHNCTFHITFN